MKKQQENKEKKDATFLLTVGSFLLTVELFLLKVDNFSFFTYNWSFFAYNFGFSTYSWSFFCLQWESASNKGLKGLQAKKLNCKQKSSNCKQKLPPPPPKKKQGKKISARCENPPRVTTPMRYWAFPSGFLRRSPPFCENLHFSEISCALHTVSAKRIAKIICGQFM